MDINSELEIIKYQLRLVGETLNSQEHPIAALVLSRGWGEKDLERAHDLFEVVSNKLEANEDVNWADFEAAFRNELSMGYQEIKGVVLAFNRNYQWTNVCEAYAHKHDCVEFHEITRAF